MIAETVLFIAAVALVGVGVFIGRLWITAQQRIVRVRQERHRWLLYTWQGELERRDGQCARCVDH